MLDIECDIKKFFASVNQQLLIKILRKHIFDENIINLLEEIIRSFKPNGLPLGNLTSQLFANIYLNELDQFVKHKLKIKYYVRYADDFVIFSEDKQHLENIVPIIETFLKNRLNLVLHPNKVCIKTLLSGIDFLGWIHFFNHRVLRRTTRKRIFKKVRENNNLTILNSYLGLISHGNSYSIKSKLLNLFDERVR